MKKQEEQKLVKLLNALYKKNWAFNWKGQDDGFELILQVGKKNNIDAIYNDELKK